MSSLETLNSPNNTRQHASGTDVPGDKHAVDVVMQGATPGQWDDVVLSYTGNNLTLVEYKLDAVTIRTLTLTYTGARLDRVEVS